MTSVGTHGILELYGCPFELLNDHEFIKRTLREAAEDAGATWLGEVSHAFSPQGVTALGLLSESHISMHTWPENGYAACDVFTCGDVAMPEQACQYLARAFRSTHHKLLRVKRAVEVESAQSPEENPLAALN